jgi:hypothetical protein
MKIETLNLDELKGLYARSLTGKLSEEELTALADDEAFVNRVCAEVFGGDTDGMIEFNEATYYSSETDILEALAPPPDLDELKARSMSGSLTDEELAVLANDEAYVNRVCREILG